MMKKRDRAQPPEGEAEGQVVFPRPTGRDWKQSHETWDKFVEPHSWAMKWCGFALFYARDSQVTEKSAIKGYRR